MSNIYDRQKTMGLKTDLVLTIVGLGGVGFWVAKFAAMSGIEKMYLFDPDVIEEHNLNRLDIPMSTIGMNKALVTKKVINEIRPEATILHMPFLFKEHTYSKSDWLVDCTDKTKSQEDNQAIAKKLGVKYLKVGYNGEHITVANRVAEWGDAVDGYTVVPSWVVPASVVAALAVGKILKYNEKEISANLVDLYI